MEEPSVRSRVSEEVHGDPGDPAASFYEPVHLLLSLMGKYTDIAPTSQACLDELKWHSQPRFAAKVPEWKDDVVPCHFEVLKVGNEKLGFTPVHADHRCVTVKMAQKIISLPSRPKYVFLFLYLYMEVLHVT